MNVCFVSVVPFLSKQQLCLGFALFSVSSLRTPKHSEYVAHHLLMLDQFPLTSIRFITSTAILFVFITHLGYITHLWLLMRQENTIYGQANDELHLQIESSTFLDEDVGQDKRIKVSAMSTPHQALIGGFRQSFVLICFFEDW